MDTVKGILAAVAAGALALGAGVAFAAPEGAQAPATAQRPAAATPGAPHAAAKAAMRRVRGEVTAVEPGARTMVVKVLEGQKELAVGVDVPEKTTIRRGKTPKALADIQVGDRVWMQYGRADGTLVADAIRILRPAHMAATK